MSGIMSKRYPTEVVLANYVTLFGPKAANPINFVTKDWIHEPWTPG